MPLSPDQRTSYVSEVETGIYHLTVTYTDPRGLYWPALLSSLDRTRILTAVGDASGGVAGKPKSKPPADLSWVSLAAEIRQAAQVWDATLRGARSMRGWPISLTCLPANADLADDTDLVQLRGDVASWVQRAAVVLGYLDPVLDVPTLYRRPCFDCGKSRVHGVASAGTAECYDCGSQYTGARVRMLIRQGA